MSRLPNQLPPDFESFFHNSLRCFYEAAAAIRINMGVQIMKYAMIALIVFLTMFVVGHLKGPPIVGLVALAAVGIYWLWTDPRFSNKKFNVTVQQIQQQAVGELVKFINPQFNYTTNAPQMDKEFRECGLFPGKLDYIREAGCVAGKTGDRLLAAVPIEAGYYTEKTVESNGVKRKIKVPNSVFKGLFISVEFPRNFNGWLTLHRDRFEEKFGWLATEMQKLGDNNVVRLEDKEFEAAFKVRASDPVVAHYVLSASFMSRMMNLNSQLSRHSFVVAFKDSVMHLALPLEVNFFASGLDPDGWLSSAQADAEAVCLIMDIMHELEMDQNIWQPSQESA